MFARGLKTVKLASAVAPRMKGIAPIPSVAIKAAPTAAYASFTSFKSQKSMAAPKFAANLHAFSTAAAPATPAATPSKPSEPKLSALPASALLRNNARAYAWVDAQAEELIARAYGQHKPESACLHPHTEMSNAELESLGTPVHYKPKAFVDYVAYGTMRFLRIFTHLFFRKKYDHHAVVLETVAAVPGIVGAAFRHLRSLRTMSKDHGWIAPLQEEAENERMHLLIWMKVAKPTVVERFLVILAQAVYMGFYSFLYLASPRSAHRMVGYLEEEAHLAYTAFLHALDTGALPNGPAPDIAIRYYKLGENATVRDVVLRVRADECMHRDFNHMLANKHADGEADSEPHFMAHSNNDKFGLRM